MTKTIESAEQQARDLLERLDHPRAQELCAGDVVELANLIRDKHELTTFIEAGQITSRKETPRLRAVRLLRELVPTFESRDKAMDHLYYTTPNASPDLRLLSIAAALYILGSDKTAGK